jgi:hypothetical protein
MNKHEAIYATHNNVVTIRGDEAFDIDGNLVTYDESVVQSYIDSHVYIAKRQQEYPSIIEQLDMLYHDKINNTNTWQTAIEAVKNKYPKG